MIGAAKKSGYGRVGTASHTQTFSQPSFDKCREQPETARGRDHDQIRLRRGVCRLSPKIRIGKGRKTPRRQLRCRTVWTLAKQPLEGFRRPKCGREIFVGQNDLHFLRGFNIRVIGSVGGRNRRVHNDFDLFQSDSAEKIWFMTMCTSGNLRQCREFLSPRPIMPPAPPSWKSKPMTHATGRGRPWAPRPRCDGTRG